MEASHWSRSLESDATVRADYALTTTTTTINLVGEAVVVVERDPLVAEHRERHLLFADPEHISPASNHVTHLPHTHQHTVLHAVSHSRSTSERHVLLANPEHVGPVA